MTPSLLIFLTGATLIVGLVVRAVRLTHAIERGTDPDYRTPVERPVYVGPERRVWRGSDYAKVRRQGDIYRPRWCEFEGCDHPASVDGLCSLHATLDADITSHAPLAEEARR